MTRQMILSSLSEAEPTSLVLPDVEWPNQQGDEMTLQVALVAKDGLLLASDTCVLHYRPNYSVAQTYTGRKIIDVPIAKVAYAFSGDELTREAGRRLETALLTGFDFARVRDELEHVANDTYAAEEEKLGACALPEVIRTLLVVFYRESPQLWKVQIKDNDSRAEEVKDFVAGSYDNTARFFKERYWRQNRGRGVEELKLFAASIILLGGKLNPLLIEGLDMAVITERGFLRLSDEEISKLTEASEGLDGLIESRLFQGCESSTGPREG
jgi:hypothetical protein